MDFILDLECELTNTCAIGDLIALQDIPRLIKTSVNPIYDNIYIRKLKTPYENDANYINWIFKDNIYVDGIIECDPIYNLKNSIPELLEMSNRYPNSNLLDLFSRYLNIHNSSDILYPSLIKKFSENLFFKDKIILDLNCNSASQWINMKSIIDYLNKNQIRIDYQIDNSNWINSQTGNIFHNMFNTLLYDIPVLKPNTMMEYYSILKNCGYIYCNFSGNSVFLTAIKKKFTSFVFKINPLFIFPEYGNYIYFSNGQIFE